MYRVKLETVGSNCYSAVRGVEYSRVRCHCRWLSPTSARPLSTKQYHCLVECCVFQFDQVDLSHRCRFSFHGMSFVSMLQCLGSTDTLYRRESRRQGWHTIAYAAQILKFVTSTLWYPRTQNQLDSS